jgi:hypothetical protein
MFVCDREWIDVVDYWNGESRVPDRLHRKRLFFDRAYFNDVVLSRIIYVWRDVKMRSEQRSTS